VIVYIAIGTVPNLGETWYGGSHLGGRCESVVSCVVDRQSPPVSPLPDMVGMLPLLSLDVHHAL
jgi:hypothetical protein